MTGLFITFEGGEGTGKSTQISLLAKYLSHRGLHPLLTREPGGTPAAEKIRALHVEGDVDYWDGLSELFLMAAARHDHVEKKIRPALSSDQIVLCDRFTDSTLAYQGYGQGVDLDIIKNINTLATGGLTPHCTFVFDILPQQGLERTHSRNSTEDRMEKMSLSFHERVRQGFLHMATQEDRFYVIDASRSAEDIHKEIIQHLLPKLPA